MEKIYKYLLLMVMLAGISMVSFAQTANAGGDKTICADETSYTLQDASASGYDIISWTSNGDGTWNGTDNGSISATYFPGTSDKSTGFVDLTITAQSNTPPTSTASNQMRLTIQALPNVTCPTDFDVCCSDGPVLLSTSAKTPPSYDEEFSGTHVSKIGDDYYFTPVCTDIDTFTITLTVTDTYGCVSSCTFEITVNALPTVDCDDEDMEICCDSGPVTLGGSPPTKAPASAVVYSGTGVSFVSGNYIFTPSCSSTDDFTITKTVTDNLTGCENSCDFTITVLALPVMSCPADFDICINDDPITLSGATPTDGEYSGDGVSSGEFDPADAGVGTHIITYEYEDTYGCVSSCTFEITVVAAPEADAGDDAEVCEGDNYQLSDATASDYASLSWATDGDGSFSSTSDLNPTYYPSGDDIGSIVTLTLTAIGNSPCDDAVSSMELTVVASPTADAGSDATTCQTSPYTLDDAEADNYASVSWTTDGDGTFDDENSLNATYYPGDNDAPFVVLTLTVSGDAPCSTPATSTLTLTVGDGPTVNAGADADICESGYQLDGSSTTTIATLWATFGDGTFSNPNIKNPFYTPGPDDKAAGQVQLAFIGYATAPCTGLVSDNMWLNIVKDLPTVYAGADATGCDEDGYTISDAVATNYSDLLWVKFNADGDFDDATAQNPHYDFGPNDKINGFALLKLVASPEAPCVLLVEDQIKISVSKSAAIDSFMADETICEDDEFTFISDQLSKLSSNVSASYFKAVEWSTDGDGTFSFPDSYCSPTAASVLGAAGFTYFELGDISNSTGQSSGGYGKYPYHTSGMSTALVPGQTYQVTWNSGYLTANASLWIDLNMDGIFSSDERLISNHSFVNGNTASFTVPLSATPGEKRLRIRARNAAGSSTDPCNNYSGLGVGGETEDYTVVIFGTNGTVVAPTYYPGSSDISNGSVELCMTAIPASPCVDEPEACMTLSIQLNPIADAGEDDTICEGETYTLSDASASYYSSVTWTGGNGSFSGGPLNPTYTPASSEYGTTVTLTLTAEAISPCIVSDDDSIDIFIQKNPTADAGDDYSVCEDGSYTLDYADASDYSSVSWSGGLGSFDDPASLNPTYTPDASEAGTTVVLTLTAEPISPCSVSDDDSMNLYVQELPTADAGDDGTVCEDDSYQLNGSATHYSSIEWSGGLGTFSDNSILNPTYSPDASEAGDTVTLTLTANPISPCNVADEDTMDLYVQALPWVSAGGNYIICEDDTYTLSDADGDNYSSVSWFTTLGDGSFDDDASMNPTYTPGNGDLLAGSVVLQVMVSPISPCTTGDSDSMTLTFQKLPTVDAGAEQTVCEGDDVQLNATATDWDSALWSGGDGTFDDDTALDAVYTPSSSEYGTTITLCVEVQPISPCIATDEDCVDIYIQYNPTANAGSDGEICVDGTYTLSTASASEYSSVSWTGGAGTFDDASNLNASYSPDASEAGTTVVLTLTANPISPCTTYDESTMELYVQALAAANAGSDATIADNQFYTVNDASAENNTIVFWDHNGNGTLEDEDDLTPTYTPGAGDAGTVVTLTLYADGMSPCSYQAVSSTTITIKHSPVVTITDPLNNTKLYDYDYNVKGTATDADGTVVKVEVNLNNGGWVETTDINPWDIDQTFLLGENTIQVKATDDDGYESNIVEIKVYLHLHIIPLYNGWQMISTFLDPNAPNAIPAIMTPVAANLTIMVDLAGGIYAPAPFNINTFGGGWNIQTAYRVRMTANTQIVIAGDPPANNDIVYPTSGTKYLPVLTDVPTFIVDAFDDPMNDIVSIVDIRTSEVFFPIGNLFTLNELQPGVGYLANFANPGVEVNYPDYVGYLADNVYQGAIPADGPWPIVRTGNVHIISIERKALADLEMSDYIGVFDGEGNCIGYADLYAQDGNIPLIVFGNDEWSNAKDGAYEGEQLIFVGYNSNDRTEVTYVAHFSNLLPSNDGKFMNNGASIITGFYKTATGISGNSSVRSVKIYPNPATDIVNIEVDAVGADKFEIVNVEGLTVKSMNLVSGVASLNAGEFAPGVYFVKIYHSSGTIIQKLVIQ